MSKGPVLKGLEDAAVVVKSPVAEGIAGAAKGALLGAGLGAVAGAASGGSATKGALITALLAAAAFGAGRAVAQDIENKERESELRVHLENLKEREPFFYMPPPKLFRMAVRSVR